MVKQGIKVNTQVSRKSNNLSSFVDNEIVILNIDRGEYNGLDEIGTEIWKALETPKKVSEIISRMADIYSVDIEICTSDVIEFLSELFEASLVEIENDES